MGEITIKEDTLKQLKEGILDVHVNMMKNIGIDSPRQAVQYLESPQLLEAKEKKKENQTSGKEKDKISTRYFDKNSF